YAQTHGRDRSGAGAGAWLGRGDCAATQTGHSKNVSGRRIPMTFAPKLAAHGAEIPAIGFGTSGLGDVRAEHIATALKAGYRHIDTARKYGTERAVGEGIRASGVQRQDIFLCTKVSHEYLHADDFARSVDESLTALDVSYVDLL